MRLRRPALRPSILIVALLLAAPAAWATVVLPQSVEDLARRADLVVRGRAERSISVASPDGKLIHTVTTVRVAATLKGRAGEVVEVRTPGGTVGDITQVAHGAPSFSAGEEVVLFLHREGTGTRFGVEGLGLGKFEVIRSGDGSAVVRRRAPDLSLLQRDGTVRPAQAVDPVPERDFLERVRRAVAAAGEAR